METISISGNWRLSPYDKTECALSTPYFEEHAFLPYNNSNSIYTTLSSMADEEELEKLRKLKWVIEREFDFNNDE